MLLPVVPRPVTAPPKGQLRHLLPLPLLLLPRVTPLPVPLAPKRHLVAPVFFVLLVRFPHPLGLLSRLRHGPPLPLLPFGLLLGGLAVALPRDHQGLPHPHRQPPPPDPLLLEQRLQFDAKRPVQHPLLDAPLRKQPGWPLPVPQRERRPQQPAARRREQVPPVARPLHQDQLPLQPPLTEQLPPAPPAAGHPPLRLLALLPRIRLLMLLAVDARPFRRRR